MNPLLALRRLGQGVWLDDLSRPLVASGTLARLVAEDGLSGVTSNPTIFRKAVEAGEGYRDDLARLRGALHDPEARYEALAIADVQSACDLLRPVYDATAGADGYVSLEVAPSLAQDEAGTVEAGQRLARFVERDNVLIKVPATPSGMRAFERLVSLGVNVNVTLIFSIDQVRRFAGAYMRGARAWVGSGGDGRRLKSVASLFLSRVDTYVDRQLDERGGPEARALLGRTAIAIAKLGYREYAALFDSAEFASLKAAGVRPQYLLWASTGTKDARYSDVHYVEPLIGPETVNTMPLATLRAFRDHGTAALTITTGVEEAEEQLAALARLGVDLTAASQVLQENGLEIFAASYAALLEAMR